MGVMLLSAYREFKQRVGYVTSAKGTKTAIVLDAINNLPQEFSIRGLQERCPTVGIDLIRRLLRRERDAGRLQCRGRGSIPILQKAKILNCKLTIQVGTTKLQHLRNTFRFPLRA